MTTDTAIHICEHIDGCEEQATLSVTHPRFTYEPKMCWTHAHRFIEGCKSYGLSQVGQRELAFQIRHSNNTDTL